MMRGTQRPEGARERSVGPGGRGRVGLVGLRRARVGFAPLGIVALVALGAGACDSDSDGSGRYTVAVEWDADVAPLGGALVFLGAPGMGAATAGGGEMIWQNTPPGEEGGLRVLLIHTGEPTSLQFTIEADARPTATLLNLTTQANLPLTPAEGYHVRIFRSQ
jgi:hypothetical protein